MQIFEERHRTCVRQEGRHLSDIIFRKLVVNVGNQNCIYYRFFGVDIIFYIENKQSYNYLKNTFYLRHTVYCKPMKILSRYAHTHARTYLYIYIHMCVCVCVCKNIDIFFFVALQPNAGHGLLILDVSRSHTTTHYSR